MPQPRPLVLELGLLAVARVELVDLAQLPAEEVLPLGAAALLGARGLELAHAPRRGRRPARRRAPARPRGAPNASRYSTCVAGSVRRHALVLRGDVAEVRGDLGELRRGAEPAVDVRAAPALRPGPPAGRRARARRDARRLELRGRRRDPAGQLEEGLDLGLLGPARTRSGRARPPRTSDKASTTIDLPAPVSPVTTLKPGASSSTRRSMRTTLRTVSWASTARQRATPLGGASKRRKLPLTPSARLH